MCHTYQSCDDYARRCTVGQKNKGGGLKIHSLESLIFVIDGYFEFQQHYVIFTIEHFIPYFWLFPYYLLYTYFILCKWNFVSLRWPFVASYFYVNLETSSKINPFITAKYIFEPTPSAASFCIMNNIVPLLILQNLAVPRVCNSSHVYVLL